MMEIPHFAIVNKFLTDEWEIIVQNYLSSVKDMRLYTSLEYMNTNA